MLTDQQELSFFNKINDRILDFSQKQGHVIKDDIIKAQKILGKKFDILNIKTHEIESIVKEIYINSNLSFESIVNVSEELFSSTYYAFGAAAIILLQKSTKKEKKIYYNHFYLLSKIYFWIEKGLIDSWPYTDSLALKVIKPLIISNEQIVPELLKWMQDENIWTKRFVIVSIIKYSKTNKTPDFWLKLIKQEIKTNDDMVYKVIGWFLKEYWKYYPDEVQLFIKNNYKKLPLFVTRTALEKMPKDKKIAYLKKLKEN